MENIQIKLSHHQPYEPDHRYRRLLTASHCL
ncbi:hypothetical protein COLO4_36664 [Corchorus olitorius]|uniref:Uncharacterized protein n=1 Tax=Corchorus olitorius TaxID=93759 RepID=A0A1R3G6Y3_9ROSI|nr:hypothetical protein COLO4_36664 [Corchorus olitorius]